MWVLKLFSISFLIYNSANVYGRVRFIFTKNYYDLYRVKRKYRIQEDQLEALLQSRFKYFKHLSSSGRNKCMARIWKIFNKIEFVGYQGIEITDEIKFCVLFSKIQLTFGLNNFRFKKFEKIILYPESFYSKFFERELKGLTSNSGFITLSWEDFEHGYFIHNDKFNLGLHEMAHALRLELDSRNIPGKMDIYNDRLDRHAWNEMNLTERETPDVLREYAKTNDEEFFAVCVEYFFEVPDLLRDLKPEIYDTLSKLLNQDPLNIHNDYKRNPELSKSSYGSTGQRAAEV
jgi:Mlc titration factor MtfA (ptsG expression regulator)